MKKAKDIRRKAYAERKEREGKNVINWIFGILVALGVLYAFYTIAFLG